MQYEMYILTVSWNPTVMSTLVTCPHFDTSYVIQSFV